MFELSKHHHDPLQLGEVLLIFAPAVLVIILALA